MTFRLPYTALRWSQASLEDKDAARRVSDIVKLHTIAGGFANVGRWIAVKLSDGASDGVLYDTRADAIRHQYHESLCAYIQIKPDAMEPVEALIFLDFTRNLYRRGLRMTDPAPNHVGAFGRTILRNRS